MQVFQIILVNFMDEIELEKEIVHLLSIQNMKSDSIIIHEDPPVMNDSLNIQEELELEQN